MRSLFLLIISWVQTFRENLIYIGGEVQTDADAVQNGGAFGEKRGSYRVRDNVAQRSPTDALVWRAAVHVRADDNAWGGEAASGLQLLSPEVE